MKDNSTLKPGLERLEKIMAHLGLASRREAKSLILKGLVKVNGLIIKNPGHGINKKNDLIVVESNSLEKKEAILLYKPRGIETSATNTTTKDIHKLFPQYKHLSPIGRLDKESEGLIILTNDGILTKSLTKINSNIEKIYLVNTREFATDESLRKMSQGIILDKIITKPAKTNRITRKSFTISLKEGRKHQIRRMCDACKLTIESLIRIQIGNLKIEKMKPGNSRLLNNTEISSLKI